MKISFGKHSGKSVELLMIKDPRYANWVLGCDWPSREVAELASDIKTLIKIFDQKPFIDKFCRGISCGKVATTISVYHGNVLAMWWCDTCNQTQLGAEYGKLSSPLDYDSALTYAYGYCNNTKSAHIGIIKTLAQAKGLSKRVGEKQAQEFFHGR